ncbi:MAG: oxidoreductase, partial [Solirubrobacteraceae bacterium]
RRLPEILSAQAPGGRLSAYRDGEAGASWSWRPAGRMCAVRVPGNFPTIAVEWLQVLAARRPVVVVTSDGDPAVTGVIAAALYRSGLPQDALSVCHGTPDVVLRGADQLVWPGEDVPDGVPADRVKTYHFGRSKAVLLPDGASQDTWWRLARLAFEGCGRLCTNLSSLAVVGNRADAESAAQELAREFAAIPLCDIEDPASRVAAWPDERRAEALAAAIRRDIATDGVDFTEPSGPLSVRRSERIMLRPTVLVTDVSSPLFGTELPFPFVAIAAVSRERVVDAVRDSLIVSILDHGATDPDLFEALAAEPTIGKVFAGDSFDRGYEPTDPQEGYLADFLFQKKALRPTREPSEPRGAR